MKLFRLKFYHIVFIPLLLASCDRISSFNSDSTSNNDSFSSENSSSDIVSDPSSGGGDTYTLNTRDLYKYQDPNLDEYHPPINKEAVTSDDLFNLHNKIEISIEMEEIELNYLQVDCPYGSGYKPDIYRCAKRVSIKMYYDHSDDSKYYEWNLDNVGIRQKGGDYSRQPIVMYEEINPHNHYKLSFNELFNDASKYDASYIESHSFKDDNDNYLYETRKFLGLEGLDFKWNKVNDLTHIREIYASYVYKAAGIISQRIGLAHCKMGYYNAYYEEYIESDFGLCTIYEKASKELIKDSLQTGDYYVGMDYDGPSIPELNWEIEKSGINSIDGARYGDMYKATYGRIYDVEGKTRPDFSTDTLTSIGIKTDVQGRSWPAYERKSNTDVTDHNDTRLRNVINKLNDDEANYEALASIIDMDYLAKEEAVSFVIGNADNLRYNSNNYELYFRKTDGKLIIIPIDNDRGFGTGCDGWRDYLELVTSSTHYPNYPYSLNSNPNPNVLITRTILDNESNPCKTAYYRQLDILFESDWMKKETFNYYYNTARTTYEDVDIFTLENDDGMGGYNITFEEYVRCKKEAFDAFKAL